MFIKKIDTVVESVLNRYVNLIIEQNEMSNEATSTMTFLIAAEEEYELSHFNSKLNQLRRTALTAGGNIDIQTKPIKRKTKNKDGSYSMRNYIEYSITPSVAVLQVPGYKFVGTITPMQVIVPNDEGTGIETHETMLTSLSNEFEGNDELNDILKQSSARMVCDGCHRETTRGVYYCFMEERTGNIKKLGGQCAAKYFGIELSNKIRLLFDALKHLGEEPYVMYDPDGFPMDKIVEPRLGSLYNSLSDKDAKDFDDKVIEASMAIAQYGASCNMKSSLGLGQQYVSVLDKCRVMALNPNGQLNREIYRRNVERAKEEHPELFALREKSYEIQNEFQRYGSKFFLNFEPKTEFEEKLKNIGLLICGGLIQKKQIGKFSYLNFIPYCVQLYFKDKEAKDPNNIQNQVAPIQPFSGTKQFTVTIDTVDKKQTRNGGIYYTVLAVTKDNELVKWFVFNNDTPEYQRGSTININAIYNNKFNTLDNVQLIGGNNSQTGGVQEKAVTYPEDGYRYSNAPFEIVKLNNDYFVVKNKNDNAEYYISNISSGFGYYDTTHMKFDVSGLSEGQVVTLTGTVGSYQSKSGKVGHKLLRVKGLPPAKW